MRDIFETGEPEPFEAQLFMTFGYEIKSASRAVLQYSGLLRQGIPHEEALSTVAALHNLSDEQIAIWLKADQAPAQQSS